MLDNNNHNNNQPFTLWGTVPRQRSWFSSFQLVPASQALFWRPTIIFFVPAIAFHSLFSYFSHSSLLNFHCDFMNELGCFEQWGRSILAATTSQENASLVAKLVDANLKTFLIIKNARWLDLKRINILIYKCHPVYRQYLKIMFVCFYPAPR